MWAPWTLTRLLYKGQKIHAQRYDYSQVTAEHIVNSESKIPVWCTLCKKTWWPTINNHINNKSGCSNCKRSKGELKCEEVLNKLQIPFVTEYSFPDLPRRYFDFKFELNGKKYLLEYDGIQHFQQQEFFNDSEEKIKKRQEHDIEKSRHALAHGYYVIRIEHTQLHKLEAHLKQAMNTLQGKFKAYYSNTGMYEYIIETLKPPNILPLTVV